MTFLKKISLCLAVLSLPALSGCMMNFIEGSGVSATETRTLTDFDSISLAGSGDVSVVKGDEFKVVVEADDNLMQYVKTEVNGRDLGLAMESSFKNPIRTKTTVRYTVTCPELKSVSVAGSGDINAEDFETDEFSIAIAGSGDVKLTGSANKLDISIAGSGDCKLQDFVVKNAEISVAGSGTARIRAEETLDVSIAGSGDVYYYGKPKVSQSIMGSGNITPAE